MSPNNALPGPHAIKRLSKKRAKPSSTAARWALCGCLAVVAFCVLFFATESLWVPLAAVSAGVLVFTLWNIYGREVDAVFDAGDGLIVQDGRREVRIPLSNVASVKLERTRQPYVRVTFRRPCSFGTHIDFFDDTKLSLNPFKYLRESDGVIALRARVENTTAQALRALEPKYSHPWPLYLVAAVLAWSFVNAPSGSIENFDATVLAATPTPKGRVNLALQLQDGTTIQFNESNHSYATGAVVACTRQRHRVTQDFSYEC